MGVKYNIDMGCRFVCHPHSDFAGFCDPTSRPQGAANQFEMWSEESLFLLVLYKGMKTKLGLTRSHQKNINKWPTCCAPLKRLYPTCC